MKTLKLFGILAVVILLIVFIIVVPRNPFTKPPVTIDLSGASVVKEMQDLNRIETASFTIEKVVSAGQDGNVFQNLLYGDKILLIAHGKVVAGVDLSTVSQKDITVRGSVLTISVPAPIIISSTLDNSKTKVYDRQRGLLSSGNKDLESEARLAAETSITQAACEGGILEEARTNAIVRLKQLFQFAGFSEVNVSIPQGFC